MSMAGSFPVGDGRRGLLKKFGWTSLSSTAQMLAGIASVIVLSRFLTPADYGMYGIAFIAVAVTEVLTSGAMSSPVEQKQEVSRKELTTIFWVNLALAVILSAITISLSAVIAPAVGCPPALQVIAAACVLATLSASGIVPESLLRRQQAFQPLARVGIVSAVTSLAVGICLAMMGAGVWALIGLEAVRRLVLVSANFALSKWRPDFDIDLSILRANFPFVSGMLAAGALGRLDRLAPQVAATAFFGPAGLGLLTVATRIADQIQAFVAQPVGTIALPVLAKAASDREEFHSLMADAWRAIAIASFPMLVGFAAIAPLLVPMLVGEAFAAVGLISAVTVLAHLRVVSSKVNIAAAQAVGKAMTASASIASSFAAHLLLLAFLAPFGVLAIASASLLRGWLTWPLAAGFVKATTGFGLGRQFAILVPPMAASLVMGVSVDALSELARPQIPAIPSLCLLIASGIAIYIAALWLFDPWVRKAITTGAWRRFLPGGKYGDK